MNQFLSVRCRSMSHQFSEFPSIALNSRTLLESWIIFCHSIHLFRIPYHKSFPLRWLIFCSLITIQSKDRKVTLDLVRRAEKAGYKALAVTVDTPVLGRREADIRNKFQLPTHLTMGKFHLHTDWLSCTDFLLSCTEIIDSPPLFLFCFSTFIICLSFYIYLLMISLSDPLTSSLFSWFSLFSSFQAISSAKAAHTLTAPNRVVIRYEKSNIAVFHDCLCKITHPVEE